jgi:DNA mismatch repair protein MutL
MNSPRVRKLSEDVVRRIAAGEVVERPASVLKELIENALDAGARRVVVEWEKAGRRLLRVTDDGCGMAPEDARLALERNATSKISSLDDLDRIATFGFRGEALPSIAAVSRFKLSTRAAGAAEGWSLECEGGKLRREGPAGVPSGTTVSVEDIFFNTPARSKFLKSDATERGLLLRAAEDASLASPRVHFRVVSDGKEAFTLPPAREEEPAAKTLSSRLEALWGAERAAGLKEVARRGRFLEVRGLASGVHAHQSTGRHQRFFVNGRPVQSRRLTHALYEAYRSALPVGRHPSAVLFLEADPAAVDVNVHPSKKEVRFSQENEVYGFLVEALREAVSGGARMPEAVEGAARREEPEARGPDRPPRPYPVAAERPSWAESRAAYNLQAPLREGSAPAPPPAAPSALPLGDFQENEPVALAQLDKTYILARLGDNLVIFDQHAAAERALYERLSDADAGRLPQVQTLLLPWVWDLSPQAAAVVKERLEDFIRLGFTLEAFGERAFRVTAAPAALGHDTAKLQNLLEGLADDLLSETIPRRWDAVLTRAACRGSVKAGQALKTPEMERIIRDLQECRSPWSCPHGRPTFLRLSPDELAKRFRRT